MNLRPKRLTLSDNIVVTYADRDSRRRPRMAIQCEAIHPKSAVGRTAWLFLDDEDVTKLLLELRDAARIARL